MALPRRRFIQRAAAGLGGAAIGGFGAKEAEAAQVKRRWDLVADVVDKYAWHKPLYRQAQIMRLQGLPVDRATLAGWVGAAAAEIKPVYLRMKDIKPPAYRF